MVWHKVQVLHISHRAGNKKDLKDRFRSLITDWFTLNRNVIYSHTDWLLSVGLSPFQSAEKILPNFYHLELLLATSGPFSLPTFAFSACAMKTWVRGE